MLAWGAWIWAGWLAGCNSLQPFVELGIALPEIPYSLSCVRCVSGKPGGQRTEVEFVERRPVVASVGTSLLGRWLLVKRRNAGRLTTTTAALVCVGDIRGGGRWRGLHRCGRRKGRRGGRLRFVTGHQRRVVLQSDRGRAKSGHRKAKCGTYFACEGSPLSCRLEILWNHKPGKYSDIF